MRTDELIRAMAADAGRTWPLVAVLPAATLAAAAAVAAVFLLVAGVRVDLAQAVMHLDVMAKQAFPLILALAAGGALLRAGCPGMRLGSWRAALAIAPALVLVLAARQLLALPPTAWGAAMMGQTNRFCVVAITLMSLPLLAAILWALRHGASTRPALSGALAGLLSGAASAGLYAIHCVEDNPLFYGVWYVLPILAMAGIGALLGLRVLRW